MKLVSLNFCLLLFATFALVSCKDDEPAKPAPPDNEFSIGDITYETKSGIFLKDMSENSDDDDNTYYRNAVVFTTEGITTSLVEGETRISGQGDVVELMLNNSGQELEAGTYTWQSEENEQPFDFWSGEITLSWDSSIPESGTEFNFQSGTVTVTKSGDKYTITFEGMVIGDANHDGVPDPEVEVSGKYEGTLSVGQRDF